MTEYFFGLGCYCGYDISDHIPLIYDVEKARYVLDIG